MKAKCMNVNVTSSQPLILGARIRLEDLIAVARYGVRVDFSDSYCQRVQRSRELVEQWVKEKRVMYGVTTGFGALCTEAISPDETAQLQNNIILSHATSVGEPFSTEQARATLLMILQNLGQGYSGVRLQTLQACRDLLNHQITPWMPREGSVGYLSPEAHLALVLTGQGQAWYQGELLTAHNALRAANLQPITLSAKEGLALISGTTSVTALAALALFDMLKAVKSADIIGALSLEALQGLIKAFDERAMAVRPHPDQAQTAANVRRILADSAIIEQARHHRVQDALSLRCIPQLHGAVKKSLRDALVTIETELNACCDNPIIWPDDQGPDVISACNPDSSYVGLAMDSACIAATMLAKMSERRNNRLIDGQLSGYPAFLIKNPGLNSGLMIPQYTQAGLLGDMRILSTPSCIDNTSTCANQEDYVASGYNAAKKAVSVAEKLEYILAIELLSITQAHQFIDPAVSPGPVSQVVLETIASTVPVMESDHYLYPHIVTLRNMLHSGQLVETVEAMIGPLI